MMMFRLVPLLVGIAIGCGVVVGDVGDVGDEQREVAYHRVCCQQDANIQIRPHRLLGATLERIIEQFDSDACVHTYGVGSADPRDQGVWPHVTLDGTRGYERHHTPLWRKANRQRSRRSSSREQLESRDMKCATVEVSYNKAAIKECPLDIFTPMCIAELSLSKPDVRVGTGEGTWDGASVVDYVEDAHHLEGDNISEFGEGVVLDRSECESIISQTMIERAVNDVDSSLDPKGVVRFLEYATRSRAPTSNIFLQSDARKVALTAKKLDSLNIRDALSRLCKTRSRGSDENCLEAVPIEHITGMQRRFNLNPSRLSRKRSFSGTQSQSTRSHVSLSGETVNLRALTNELTRKNLVSTIKEYLHYPSESRICDYPDNARLLDFVLTRAFLAVSRVSYARLYDGAMLDRLSTRKHWMLAACGSDIKISMYVPRGGRVSFLRQCFQVRFEGKSHIEFLESATLADIDTRGIDSPTCAVLAGVADLFSRKPEDGKVDVLIAFFKRDAQGRHEVTRSLTERAELWRFFPYTKKLVPKRRMDDDPSVGLGTQLRDFMRQIETMKLAPTESRIVCTAF